MHILFSYPYTNLRKNVEKIGRFFEMVGSKKCAKWNCVIVLMITLVIGSLLHNVYEWLPNGFTALIAPVNESLWEHTKIIFYPLLLAGLLCNKERNPVVGAAWGLAAVGASLFMLGTAYVYHRVFRQDSLVFDLILYVITIVSGFLLARFARHLTVEKGWRAVSRIAGWGMFLFILLRTVLFLRYPA